VQPTFSIAVSLALLELKMSTPKRLLLAFAHPDDESNLAGSTIAKYSAEGADVLVVIATRGEVGEIAPGSAATRETLGAVREAELRAAVAILGASLALLDYRDSGMPGAPENTEPRAFVQAAVDEVVGKLVTLIRRQKPHVVVTFDENGGYGHPDHIAISKTTTLAFYASGDARYVDPEALPAWAPSKLYYMGIPRERLHSWIEAYTRLKPHNDYRDMDLNALFLPESSFTTRLDVRDYIPKRRQAIEQHRSEINMFEAFPASMHEEIFSHDYFALIYPGRTGSAAEFESDLFEGI
jgi:LmbE family N-acetylglucosaminyl deacetylase